VILRQASAKRRHSIKPEVRIYMRSGKIRVLVFAVFLLLLLVFAVAYEPTNAASQPANQGNTADLSTKQAAQGQ